MFAGVASYVGGALAGFALGALAMLALFPEAPDWIALNMGHSVWLFALVLVFYAANLARLNDAMKHASPIAIPMKQIVQLDQLSDVWIHLFIGIGVVWTAIGMRAALSTTLDAPGTLTEDAGEVLARLVDGGILLALTTTIVGAIGGYLMRLAKTIFLGADLADYYHRTERNDLERALDQLSRIESLLADTNADTNPEKVVNHVETATR